MSKLLVNNFNQSWNKNYGANSSIAGDYLGDELKVLKINHSKPKIKIINQSIMDSQSLKSTKNYYLAKPAADNLLTAVSTVTYSNIVNTPSLNNSDCTALKMLQIFSIMAHSMQTTSEWQKSTLEMTDQLNTCLLDLSAMLADISATLNSDRQEELLNSMKTSGIIGLFISIATVALGSLMAAYGNPVGVLMVANGITQAVGNIACISDPQSALKDGSWQTSLAKNGIFAPFDACGENGGQIAQSIASVLTLLGGDVASVSSIATNSAVLTGGEIAARTLLIIDNLVKSTAMTINLVNTYQANDKGNDNSKDNVWTALSMGSLAGLSHEVMHITKADDNTTSKVIDMILGISLGVAFQAGLQKKGFSNPLEAHELNKLTSHFRELSNAYNIFTQAKSLNNTGYNIENSLRSLSTADYKANSEALTKNYEYSKKQVEQLLNNLLASNKGLGQDQESVMDLIKQVEQVFAQIFTGNR